MTDKNKPEKRKRGGQQGNQNARTHGFYSSTLTPDEINSIWHLISRDHVDPDVAILRIKLMSLVHQYPADRRVLQAAVRIIVQWSSSKYNLNQAERALLRAAIAEYFEQQSGISLTTIAQKLLLRKNDISLDLPKTAGEWPEAAVVGGLVGAAGRSSLS